MQPDQENQNPVVENQNIENPQNEKNQFLRNIVIVLFFGLLVLVGYIIFALISNKPKNTMKESTQTNSTGKQESRALQKSTDKEKFTTVWRKADDKTGSTIIYRNRIRINDDSRKATEDSGWYTLGSTTDTGRSYRYAITGMFQGFKTIEDSSDIYILLTIPEETEPVKVRILNEISKLQANTTDKDTITAFTVENLDVIVADEKNRKQGEDYLGRVKNVPGNDFPRLFKKDDIVTLILLRKEKEFIPMVDEEGSPLARNVSIRRFGGAKQIERELLYSLPIVSSQN